MLINQRYTILLALEIIHKRVARILCEKYRGSPGSVGYRRKKKPTAARGRRESSRKLPFSNVTGSKCKIGWRKCGPRRTR
jgi:hypothetical protein